MKVVVRDSKSPSACQLVAVCRDSEGQVAKDRLDASSERVLEDLIEQGLFRGERGELSPALSFDKGGAKGKAAATTIFVGVGKLEQVDIATLRNLFGAIARRLGRLTAKEVGLRLDRGALPAVVDALDFEPSMQALSEGAILGGYRYVAQKSKPPKKKSPPTLVLAPGRLGAKKLASLRKVVREAADRCRGVELARDLANEPANQLYPQVLATRARAVARSTKLRCTVLGKADLETEKLGGILGVGQGSDRQPRLIVLEHRARRKSAKTVVLVGKAVTFDTGGISIKPSGGMEDMKFDMAGGAAVIGAMQVIEKISPAVHVVGLVPSAENHISGSALRPGDVIRSGAGKTVEVINTDAEGRLLLADAIWYARRYKPDAVIDIATLTGACVVALGADATGLFSNDDDLVERIEGVSRACGERVWHLPLFREHYEMVKSQVADLRNSSGRNAGASTAGAFLGHFAEGLTWAHLDIAGTGWTKKTSGERALGATGVGVRLLVDIAASFAD